MNHQQVLQAGITVVLVSLFLVGCVGSLPAIIAEVPAATSAPEQAAATPTLVPPTPIPAPPTATSTPGSPAATPTPQPPTATPIPEPPSGAVPGGGKPLSVILKSVEDQKPGSITGAEFDNGLWEVEVCAAAACQTLYIDPKSGAEIRRKKTDPDEIPPANVLTLSTIVQSLEAREPGIITEVEFDAGFWEVELRKDGRKIRLVIDPRTGETRP